jgi:hypothetical protein
MIGDISLLDNYVNFISRHHGRRGPKEPIFRVVVPFAVLINASFTYSELNITIPEDSLDIVARAPAENPISSARLSSQVTQSQRLGSSCGSRQRAAFSKSDEELITKERLKMWPAIYKDDIQRCMGSTCGSQQRLPVRREIRMPGGERRRVGPQRTTQKATITCWEKRTMDVWEKEL